MPTKNLGLPLITDNMNANIPRDMNALAEEVDSKVAGKQEIQNIDDKLTTHLADNETHVTTQERISWNAKEDKNNKNKVNGYVGLDGNGKINPVYLQDSIRLELEYLKINYNNY